MKEFIFGPFPEPIELVFCQTGHRLFRIGLFFKKTQVSNGFWWIVETVFGHLKANKLSRKKRIIHYKLWCLLWQLIDYMQYVAYNMPHIIYCILCRIFCREILTFFKQVTIFSIIIDNLLLLCPTHDHMIIIVESVSICLGTLPRENIPNQPWPKKVEYDIRLWLQN